MRFRTRAEHLKKRRKSGYSQHITPRESFFKQGGKFVHIDLEKRGKGEGSVQ